MELDVCANKFKFLRIRLHLFGTVENLNSIHVTV